MVTPSMVCASKLAETHSAISCAASEPHLVSSHAIAGNIVAHQAFLDEALELVERRGRVGAIEAADGHNGQLACQLVTCRALCTSDGGCPAVLAGIFLQQGGNGPGA